VRMIELAAGVVAAVIATVAVAVSVEVVEVGSVIEVPGSMPRSLRINNERRLNRGGYEMHIISRGRALSAAPPGKNEMCFRKDHGPHGCRLPPRCQPPPGP
jgi:hypothetical protein